MSLISVVMVVTMVLPSCLPAQPHLEVERTIDWGTVVPDVPPGETAKITKDVTLKNTGNEMLRISEVRPSCGCTSAPLDQDSLEPGESTTMRVTLNLPLSNGTVTKYLTIRSNDRDDPVKQLTLKADLQRPLQLSSSFIPFNQGQVGKPVLGAMTLSSFTDKDVHVTVTTKDKGLTVLTPKFTITPKGAGEIKVEFLSEKEGPFQAEIEIKTDLKGYESFSIKGYGAVDPQ